MPREQVRFEFLSCRLPNHVQIPPGREERLYLSRMNGRDNKPSQPTRRELLMGAAGLASCAPFSRLGILRSGQAQSQKSRPHPLEIAFSASDDVFLEQLEKAN